MNEEKKCPFLEESYPTGLYKGPIYYCHNPEVIKTYPPLPQIRCRTT